MDQRRWKMVSGMLRRVMKRWAPPPRLTVSEWADRYRYLSPEASAEPGKWNTQRAPYQKEMMDAVSDPAIEEITFKTSAQIGKTEIINNLVGYLIDMDPGPMLIVQPTLEMAGVWSKDRLAPMIRDTPRLRDKVHDVKSRTGDNTILQKRFPGGHLAVGGANSPASLAGRPIRVVIMDDKSRFPVSAGTEGSPGKLTRKRTTTFWNRKIVNASTPTIEGICAIDDDWQHSDQRRCWLPCPHCGGMHLLAFFSGQNSGGIVWETVPSTGSGTGKDEHHPETAAHVCPHCGGMEYDADLPRMLAGREWRAEHPERRRHAGFALNELYSPWVPFASTVNDYLEAKDDPEKYKVWINTAMGECWKEGRDIGEAETLMELREQYDAEIVPMAAAIITVGVDVQDDRLELEAVAWGKGKESWGLEYVVIPGNPGVQGSPENPGVWEKLDAYLGKRFVHESGLQLRITAVGVDTGGHHTDQAYKFCQRMEARRVYGLKGKQGQGIAVSSRPVKNNTAKVSLYHIGVDTIKDVMKANLDRTLKVANGEEEQGPGCCHWPYTYGKAWFEGYLAERISYRLVRGQKVRSWVKKKENVRNEPWDCRVYAHAALEIAYQGSVDQWVELVMAKAQGKVQGKTPAAAKKNSGVRVISRGIAA